MPMTTTLVLTVLTLLCALMAQRLAISRGRKPFPWMLAAVTFGPFPLIPLALLSKRSGA
jgi:hypothetical protein